MDSSPTIPRPIDPRGPRVNQGVLAVGLLLGFLLDVPAAIPAFAVVLGLGAAFGPRRNPVIRVWSDLVRPRLGPPTELEDPRPPRFAATIGAAVLGIATVFLVLGRPGVAWALALVVVALAGLAAISGICVGCQIWLVAVARGELRRSVASGSVPAELVIGEPRWVLFTTPWCASCGPVEERLRAGDPATPILRVDATERADLAGALAVRRSPTAILVGSTGEVLARLVGPEAVDAHLTRVRSGADGAEVAADLR